MALRRRSLKPARLVAQQPPAHQVKRTSISSSLSALNWQRCTRASHQSKAGEEDSATKAQGACWLLSQPEDKGG